MRRPRDTRKSGRSGLAIADQINVLDFFSTGADDGVHHQVEEETQDAPEISNKVVFIFNSLTSFLTI